MPRNRTSDTPVPNDSRDTVKCQWTKLWDAVKERERIMYECIFKIYIFLIHNVNLKKPSQTKNQHQITQDIATNTEFLM